jgi:Na+/H+ antiporter NhaD/arsenite permease-like protein
MNGFVLTVFALVYAVMIIGRMPGTAIDRTGAALLGAVALIGGQAVSLEAGWRAIDVSTIALLFGLMLVSAQFRIGGFYSRFTQRLAGVPVTPQTLMLMVILAAAVLSAVLTNDIVCLAMAPLLAEGCLKRKLNPVPFLLALACASNIGSAATLIGNPQNILIGQRLNLNFVTYLGQAIVPTLLSLLVTWWFICRQAAGCWEMEHDPVAATYPEFNRWQTGKGLVVTSVLLIAFLIPSVPRDVAALVAGAVILTSRKATTRSLLHLIDWHLLVLFGGLFIVNDALQAAGLLERGLDLIRSTGIDPAQPGWLFGLTVLLSNTVSNVPATLLLLPVCSHPLSGPILALSSTLAGNLLVVGSIANIIVIDQAAQLGIRINWKQHARVGIPVTLLTLGIAALWLILLSSPLKK